MRQIKTEHTIPCKTWGGRVVVKIGEKWHIVDRPVKLESIEIIK
jgi:hypothetical protein